MPGILQSVLSVPQHTETAEPTVSLSSDLLSQCASSTFAGNLTLTGADFTSVTADPVFNFSDTAPEYLNFGHPNTSVFNATFCNVTVTYTHPGQGDFLTINAYLPISNPSWNGRFQAVGGGGWVAGMFSLSYAEMVGALSDGYATITTDAGVATDMSVESWALLSEGNVNLYGLQNLGSVSLRDEAIIGKNLIASFYGEGPKYSYWSGCSQGGRQGMMLAQRYPDLYDGIAANAPAVNWAKLFASIFWPQLVIDQYLNGTEPAACEINELTSKAIQDCDKLDGIVDGLISEPDLCLSTFHPDKYVGTSFNCSTTGKMTTISQEAVILANATWHGPRHPDGSLLWYGLFIGSPLAHPDLSDLRNILGGQWLRLFVKKNSTFDMRTFTVEDMERSMHRGAAEFDCIVGTNYPDLREFKELGGKILAYHGLADPIIPSKNSEHYFNSVTDLMGNVDDFYRMFEVPGLAHCYGGNGGQPTTLFAALVDWVENGTVPETIPISFQDPSGAINNRILCPYPLKAVWDGVGDTTEESSFYCA
ncbi:Tannase/feruloyl esterase [Pseudomassariella vexata]|uniref:Carboxylic ester hydrolase n=1 Tax=Pseudomassariella vexata TaxID=1141098 RepID=A0A1Y2E1Q9_9PEZI|nr:Tannase/feruloyl esterase [Pseudomassariella vexata]ORY64805.1 Tannase/feruloyl esterase [Pseudomassariella vexata]